MEHQIELTAESLWDEVASRLKGALNEATFGSWFGSAEGIALSDDAVTLDAFSAAGHERVALLLGAEGDGLSRRALDAADTIVTIPMAGGVDSLNVAAASAVALWELGRALR